MTEKLEGSDWHSIETIVEGVDNIYAYKFTKKTTGNPVWVAWWDYFEEPGYTEGDTKQVTITGINDNKVVVTNSVPKYSTGAEVTDYNTAFTATTLNVGNNSATITLGETPVFVEEASNVSIERKTDYSNSEGLGLNQSFQNPFHPGTAIHYRIPANSKVSLKVFDVVGREIRTLVNGKQATGNYKVAWVGNDEFGNKVNDGIYFCALKSDKGFSQTRQFPLFNYKVKASFIIPKK